MHRLHIYPQIYNTFGKPSLACKISFADSFGCPENFMLFSAGSSAKRTLRLMGIEAGRVLPSFKSTVACSTCTVRSWQAIAI